MPRFQNLGPVWYFTPDFSNIPNANKRLLFYISAAVRKSILLCWIDHSPPTQRVFLEKLSFLFRMDWVETALNKEKKTKLFFATWSKCIRILPLHIKNKTKDLFRVYYMVFGTAGSGPLTY